MDRRDPLMEYHFEAYNMFQDMINSIKEEVVKFIYKVQLKKEEAEKFYQIHKGKFFYDDLIKFMISGPCVVLVLSKENAVKNFRDLIGNTDPEKAKNKSIRHKFGLTNRENAVHGSDSLKNSKKEIAFFFSNTDIINI